MTIPLRENIYVENDIYIYKLKDSEMEEGRISFGKKIFDRLSCSYFRFDGGFCTGKRNGILRFDRMVSGKLVK